MVWSVALRPAYLSILGLSLLLLADPAARLAGALGVLAYAAVVWRCARGGTGAPQDWGQEPGADTAARPRRADDADPVARAEAALARIEAATESAGRSLARVLSPVCDQAAQVVQRLESLVARARLLDRFLARQNREHLEREIAALDARIAACADEIAREHYLQARRTRGEQLRDYDELALCRGRVQAQITNVLSALEAAEARVMVLQAADLRHAGTVGDAVTRSLQELSQELSGLQESIDATIAIRMRE